MGTITFVNTANMFQTCNCMHRILSNIKWGKNKYGTILYLKIQLICPKICRCINRILCNIIWEIYKYRIILVLKIHSIYFKVCMCVHEIFNNITWGIYVNGTI